MRGDLRAAVRSGRARRWRVDRAGGQRRTSHIARRAHRFFDVRCPKVQRSISAVHRRRASVGVRTNEMTGVRSRDPRLRGSRLRDCSLEQRKLHRSCVLPGSPCTKPGGATRTARWRSWRNGDGSCGLPRAASCPLPLRSPRGTPRETFRSMVVETLKHGCAERVNASKGEGGDCEAGGGDGPPLRDPRGH